jgi:thymidylate synthase (FAD)
VHDPISVLDHGSVQLVESWGTDERVIEAARMSTGKGFLGWGPVQCSACRGFGYTKGSPIGPWDKLDCPDCGGTGRKPGDEKLLSYLWSKKHTTPFEMAGLTVEVMAPIAVFREWHRHRTQSYNEMSARYVPLPDVNYVPTPDRCLTVQAGNKQAQAAEGAKAAAEDAVQDWLDLLTETYGEVERVYRIGLMNGVPKELARLILPVGRYSRMRASANLWNWLRFLRLRMAPDAQWEIRQYAAVIGTDLIANLFPRTWALFKAEFDKGASQ